MEKWKVHWYDKFMSVKKNKKYAQPPARAGCIRTVKSFGLAKQLQMRLEIQYIHSMIVLDNVGAAEAVYLPKQRALNRKAVPHIDYLVVL